MAKKTLVMLGLLLLMAAGAYAHYPGETITIPNEMGIENLVYTIIENTTTAPTLDVTINSSNITITFPGDMAPNSFVIVFLENQTRTVVQTVHHHSSGGGSHTRYVDRNITVEVPKYIDKETIVTETVENVTELPCDDKNNALNGLIFVFLLVFIVLAYYIITNLIEWRKNNHSAEREVYVNE